MKLKRASRVVIRALSEATVTRNVVLLIVLGVALSALHHEKVLANLQWVFGSPDSKVKLSQRAYVSGYGLCNLDDALLAIAAWTDMDYKCPNYLVINAARIDGSSGDSGLTTGGEATVANLTPLWVLSDSEAWAYCWGWMDSINVHPKDTCPPTDAPACAALGLFWDEASQVCSNFLGGGGGLLCYPPYYLDPNFGTCEYVGDIGNCNPYAYLNCIGSMGWWDGLCNCNYNTPIIVDVLGDGYNLTNLSDGVRFTFEPGKPPRQLSWTAAGSDDAFLVFDRNGNGLIDDGTELFGNLTPQAPSDEPNGFLGLAEFDKPANGGNSDGVIDRRDSVYDSLRLWQDVNHDGVSQSAELHTLHALGLRTMELDYRESKRRDEHGNWFRYRAKVKDARGAQLGRWAWDVFLMSSQ